MSMVTVARLLVSVETAAELFALHLIFAVCVRPHTEGDQIATARIQKPNLFLHTLKCPCVDVVLPKSICIQQCSTHSPCLVKL